MYPNKVESALRKNPLIHCKVCHDTDGVVDDNGGGDGDGDGEGDGEGDGDRNGWRQMVAMGWLCSNVCVLVVGLSKRW